MTTDEPAGLAFARDFQAKIPYIGHLGVVTETPAEGLARLTMPLAPEFTNSFGTAHGGVILSLLDIAMCTAVRTLHPDSVGVMTIDLSTAFIGGGSSDRLVAEARVVRDGTSVVFAEAEARNADGSLVARAMGTLRVRLPRS
jgi:uncharacterized protein (TIGR00369 family)